MIFHKMHGTGNDYVFVDCIEEHPEIAGLENASLSDMARRISDRHFGVGSDGLILILPSDAADCRMRMFNSDGSEAEMCGNGVRCLAKYVREKGLAHGDDIAVETGAGVLSLSAFVENGLVRSVRVNMGLPRLASDRIPVNVDTQGDVKTVRHLPKDFSIPPNAVIAHPLKVLDREFWITCVSMGNPHCVVFVDDAKNFPLEKYGPAIETNEIFPRRTNVEFVTVANREEVAQRTWERGAGETLACGTGAGAVCVAAALNGLTGRKVLVRLSGGDLHLEWSDDCHIYMTGPAEYVFRGEWRT